MNVLFKSDWSTITAKADKVVEIDIDGNIGFDWWSEGSEQNTKERMKAELKAIDEIKASKIIVNINSYGGDVNHGISIHDLLKANKAEVETRVTGMTASAATVIAQAGDVRTMSDNALYLVHNASSGVWGNKNALKAVINDLDKVDGRLANLYAKRSGKDAEHFQNLMEESNGEGVWLTADEALDNGLIDSKFEPVAMAANRNFNHKKYGYPSFESKFQNLNNSKMENETTEKVEVSVLDKILAAITPKKQEPVKAALTDEEIQAIADATKAKVEAVEAAKQVEIDALNAATQTALAEIAELKAKNAKLEAKETGSTKPDETLDKGKTVEPEFSSMVTDQLNKIKAKLGVN